MPGVKVLLKGMNKVIEFPPGVTGEQIEQIIKNAESLPYMHNKAPNPYKKTQGMFGMDVEPAGQYITPLDEAPSDLSVEFISGTKQFKKPLVMPFGDLSYDSEQNWKRALSAAYGGKKGKSLTNALRKDGYDAILTVDEQGNLAEAVDLYKGKGGVDMAASAGLLVGGASLSPDEARAQTANPLMPNSNNMLLSIDQLNKLPSHMRPDVGSIQGPIKGDSDVVAAIQNLGGLLSKFEVPVLGNPLQGLADYMQNFGYNDSEKERLKRAAMAVLDFL